MASFKPIFKRPEDDISVKVEERIKGKLDSELDNRIKTEVDKRVTDILKEREEKEKTDKASKLAKAVDVAKALKGESDSEKDKTMATDKDLLCPSCHKDHVHKMETDKSGLVYKCHEDKCGLEFVMVPKDSDYKCVGCGSPLKKPANVEHAKEMEGCPFCGSKKAIRFQWDKLWNVSKKK